MNLDGLSPAELRALIQNAEEKMEAARKKQIQETRSKIDALLKHAGLTISEVYPRIVGRAKGGQGTQGKVEPKYRNPADTSQTWSGRGKRPAWFIAAVAKRGVTPESLLIGGAGPTAVPAKNTSRKPTTKRAAKKK
jgi:DNA-binding protein H-NS